MNDKENNVTFVKLVAKAAIQDVGLRGPIIKNNLDKNNLRGIIYNVEDGNVNMLIWGDEKIINESLRQIKIDAEMKGRMFEPEIGHLSVNILPPQGVFVLEDTEKDKDRKFDKEVESLTAVNRHMQNIEEELRNIKIQIDDISTDLDPREWRCTTVKISKAGYDDSVEIKTPQLDPQHGEIVSLKSLSDYIRIYDIKLILDGHELSEDALIMIQKRKNSDGSFANAGMHLDTCKYKELRDIFSPINPIILHRQENVALFFKTTQKDVQLKDVWFTAKICTKIKKEKDDVGKKFGF